VPPRAILIPGGPCGPASFSLPLHRRVMDDMCEDFGFRIGRWNQAYMLDTLPVVLTEAELKPGDLIFYTVRCEGGVQWSHTRTNIRLHTRGPCPRLLQDSPPRCWLFCARCGGLHWRGAGTARCVCSTYAQGTYFSSTAKRQKHDCVHVEISLATPEAPERTIG
jgi:hypothetical protein